MMDLCHPMNAKFALFYSIDKSYWKLCHILTVLKLAESYVHAMILALLPYLLWKYMKKFGEGTATIAKWFKPATHALAADAYWDPKDKCIKNTSTASLHWHIANMPPPSPKQKCNQAEDESLDNFISTVKTVPSNKKNQLKSALKTSTLEQVKKTTFKDNREMALKDATMVALHNTTISQLTKQISIIKMENKQILNQFDHLASQMETFLNFQTPCRRPCKWTSGQKWCRGAEVGWVRATYHCIAV